MLTISEVRFVEDVGFSIPFSYIDDLTIQIKVTDETKDVTGNHTAVLEFRLRRHDQLPEFVEKLETFLERLKKHELKRRGNK